MGVKSHPFFLPLINWRIIMTYWNNNGRYQEQQDVLNEAKIIPIVGKCEYTYQELYRIASNCYYDIYNNGGCNGNHFQDLLRELDYINKPDNISSDNWYKLRTLLHNGADEDRDFYLFSFRETENERHEKQLLNIVEEFIDWVVLTTYEEYMKRNNK